jgi:hypothetical protein
LTWASPRPTAPSSSRTPSAALIHKGTLKQVCDPEKGQRHAVEAGVKAKLYSYQKTITNFDSKRSHIFFATTGTCGDIGKDYAKLISLVARIQHPGVGVDGKYDVDGLRSQAVAFARRTVGAGVWRANYMTISLWASRTYGPRPLWGDEAACVIS